MPRKNLMPLAGISLLARAIRCAKGVPGVNRVVVSTDNQEIADAARIEGAEVPFLRPAELASDSAREWQAWRHAVDFVENQPGAKSVDIFVSVPTVCPLRTSEDVARAVALYRKGNADIVFSVTPSAANPYYNMVEIDDSTGAAALSKPPEAVLHGRQKAPVVYDVVAAVLCHQPGLHPAIGQHLGGPQRDHRDPARAGGRYRHHRRFQARRGPAGAVRDVRLSDDIKIRTARSQDAVEIARIHVEAWRDALCSLAAAGISGAARSPDRGGALEIAPPSADWRTRWLADCDGEVAGYAIIGPARGQHVQPAGEIYALYVETDWREQGIGRALVDGRLRPLPEATSLQSGHLVPGGQFRRPAVSISAAAAGCSPTARSKRSPA